MSTLYAWRLLRSFCSDANCPCVASDPEPCEEWIDDWGHRLRRCIRCGHYPEAHK